MNNMNHAEEIKQLKRNIEVLNQELNFREQIIEDLEANLNRFEVRCTICLEYMSNTCTISCGHTFCYDCLYKWPFEKSNTETKNRNSYEDDDSYDASDSFIDDEEEFEDMFTVNKHFEREKEVQLLKQQKRSNYQFEKTYNINDSPDTYYIDEETIDQFTKLNRRIANKIKTEVRNRIETFNSRDKLNISYLCEPLWIVLNEYITSGLLKINSRKFKFYFPNKVTVNAEFNFNTIKKNEKEEPESRYGIILKDQPKTVRILISAIETSEIHINYILSVWKNPSDRYNEKNSIQRLKNENSNTIEQKLNKILHLIEIRFTYSNEQEILDKPKLLIFAALFFKYCDQNPHLKKKPKKNDASTNTEQLNIEDIIDLINEERTEELHQALKDFKSRRKHMTSIFPLIKEVIQLLAFKSFNDDKESLPGKVSRKNAQQKVLEYLKVSLNLFLHCIAFGLVFFMGNPLGDIKSWNFMNETNFEKTFNLLKENDELKLALEKKNNSCETKIMNGLVDYANNLDLDIEDLSYLTKSSTLEIWENNKNEEEDDMNEVGEQNQSTMDYINQKENGEVIPYNIDNIDRNPKRVMRRIRKDENLDREKLMSYSDYIKRLRSDTSIYDMFKDDIDNLSLAITSLSSLRNPASRRPSKIEGLKRLTPDIFKLNK
ncbi:24322_t:CDS:2 [Gigaspora rosea]|nr:24322_t:CDS:2 [Gigaspora rosea]